MIGVNKQTKSYSNDVVFQRAGSSKYCNGIDYVDDGENVSVVGWGSQIVVLSTNQKFPVEVVRYSDHINCEKEMMGRFWKLKSTKSLSSSWKV